jgi:cytochrome c556
MRSVVSFTRAVALLPLLVLPALEAVAQDDQAVIDYRQKLMTAVGANMGAISDIMKNGLPQTQNVAVHAENLDRNGLLIASAFEAQVVEGPTDAKPEIWQDKAGFAEAIEKMRLEAAKLAVIAASRDPAVVGPQVKALGKACGGCHKSFRKPKEESYKREQ